MNSTHDTQETPTPASAQTPETGLATFALICSSVPAGIIFLLSLVNGVYFFIAVLLWPITLLVPVAGMLMGIFSLCRGEERIGSKGVILSVLAIIVPIAAALGMTFLDRAGAFTFSM